jgi:hypothetical protein
MPSFINTNLLPKVGLLARNDNILTPQSLVVDNNLTVSNGGNVSIGGNATISTSNTEALIIENSITTYDTDSNVITLSGGTSSTATFITKYNNSGVALWATRIDGTGGDEGWGITTDDYGSIYVTGHYNSSGSINIYDSGGVNTTNNIVLPATGSVDKSFIIKYDTNGIAQWGTIIDGTSSSQGYGIAINNSNVYVTGYYNSTGSVNIYNANDNEINNPISIPTTTSEAIFTVKYDSDGKVKWSTTIDGSGTDEEGRGIVMDADGNTYVTGWYSSSSAVTVRDAGSTSSTSNVTLPIASSISAFLVKYDTNGISQWATTIDGTGADRGFAISLDSSSNIYITGEYNSTTTTILYDADGSNENNIVLPISTGTDSFIAKYNNNGVAQWATLIQGTSTESGRGIVIDNNNNVYAAGYYNSTGSINIYNADDNEINNPILLPSTTSEAVFAVKYDTDGKVKWATTIDGTGTDEEGRGIVMDADGNTYVTGWYSSSSAVTVRDAGSTSSTSNVTLPIASSISAFLVKYDTNGVSQWATRIDGTGTDKSYGISLDNSSNIYITGEYYSTTTTTLYDADGGNENNIVLPISSGTDSFIAKYNANGVTQWATLIQGTSTDSGQGIAIDNNNNVYATGYYNSSVHTNIYDTYDINNPISIPATSGEAIFTVKYDTNGKVKWATTIDGTGTDEEGRGIVMDADGNTYVTGWYSSTNVITVSDAGSTSSTSNVILPAASSISTFLVKYDTNGVSQWATRIDGSGTDQGYGISLDSSSNIYITGYYNSTTTTILYDADGGNENNIVLPISTETDSFIAKYNNNGIAQWATIIQGTSTDSGYGIAIDNDDNLYITGKYVNTSIDLLIDDINNPISIPATTSDAIFAVKYGTDGLVKWATTIDGTGTDEEGRGVVMDADGNTYITGWYSSTSEVTVSDAGSTSSTSNVILPISSSISAFLVKYDTNGVSQWATYIDGTGTDVGLGISLDNSSNVYITGNYNSTTTTILYDADGGTTSNIVLPISTGTDSFIAKYNSDGITQWATLIQGTITESGRGIVIDNNNNVYAAGHYKSTGSINIYNSDDNNITNPVLLPATSKATFTVKYDTDGKVKWATTIDGTGTDEEGKGIVMDADGNTYITGWYSSSSTVTVSDAGSTSSTSNVILPIASSISAFLVKYDTNGISQWATTIDGTGADRGLAISLDSSSNVYITGNYNSTTTTTLYDADGNNENNIVLPISTGQDSFIAKYNNNGIAQWATLIQGTSTDSGQGISIDNNNNVYATGYYSSSVHTNIYDTDDINNPISIPATSGEAIFTVKYGTDGKVKWATAINGTGTDEEGKGIVMDADGNTYVTGWYSSTSEVTVSDAGSTSSTNNVILPISSSISAFLVKYDTNGVSQWATYIDGTGTDKSYGISLDNSSNIYITGEYYSTTTTTLYDADGGTTSNISLPTSTGIDSFIAKYNNDGIAQWATLIKGSGTDVGFGIAIDNDDNLYATGYYNNSIELLIDDINNPISIPATSYEAIFTIKYDTDGKVKWATTIDGSGTDEEGRGIVMDADGNTYVTGWYSSSSAVTVRDAGSTSSTSNVTLPIASSISAFLVKYDTNGVSQWATCIDGTGTDKSYGISLDNSSNIYITGEYYSTTTTTLYDADGGTTSNISLQTSTGDSFIAKYNNDGIAQWATLIKGSGTDSGQGITIDNNNNVYATGYYNSTGTVSIKDSDGGTANNIYLRTPPSGSEAAYLVKYNSDGIAQWAATIEDPSAYETRGFGITTDSSGNVYITGYYNGNHLGTIYNAGNQASSIKLPDNNTSYDIFIVKFNSSGIAQWANKIRGTSDYYDYGYGIVTDSADNVYITGLVDRIVGIQIYNNDMSIPPAFEITDPGNTGYACILVKYDQYGTPQWAAVIDGTANNNGETGFGITVDSYDNIYLTGKYGSTSGATIYNAISSSTFPIDSGLGLPYTNQGDATFIVKYNSEGLAQWATIIDGTSTDVGYGIAAMGSEIVVTGTYNSTSAVSIKRGNIVYLPVSSSSAAYLVKYNSLGEPQWAAKYDSASYALADVSYNTTIDKDNNVIIAGYCTRGYNSGTNNYSNTTYVYNKDGTTGGTVPGNSDNDAAGIIVKYNPNGFVQWVVFIDSSADDDFDYVRGVATDSIGNVYAIGYHDSASTTYFYNSNGGTGYTLSGTSTSNDIYIVKYNINGSVEWVAQIRGAGSDVGISITVDENDYIYVTGYYNTTVIATIYNAGNINSGLSLPVGSGTYATFVVKFNSEGIAQWATIIDGSGDDVGNGIAAMGSEIVVTGYYNSTSSVPIRRANNIYLSIPIDYAIYLVKYNSDGIAQWAASVDSSGIDYGFGVTTDRSGNVYITGMYNANVIGNIYNAGNITSSIKLPDNDTSYDIYIIKYNSNGEAQWANKIRGTGSYPDYGRGIVTDSANNVYITGFVDRIVGIQIYNNNMSTLAFEITDPGDTGYACILVKYDSYGTPQWAAIIDNASIDNNSETGFGITVDSNDNIYLTGSYGTANGATIYNAISSSTSPIDSGLSLPVGSGTTGAFVVKYNSDGLAQWATTIDGTGDDVGLGIAVMGSEIVVTGYYNSTSDVPIRRANSIYLRTPIDYAIYLVKYNSDGIAQWAASVDSSGIDSGFGVTTDSSGNVYITGRYNANVIGNIYNAGNQASSFTLPDNDTSYDIYVVKFNSEGIAIWVNKIGGTNSDYSYSIVTDSSDNVYITGFVDQIAAINIYTNDMSTVAFTIPDPGDTGYGTIIVKYDSFGNPQWATLIDGTANNNNEVGYGITVDDNDNIYITGSYGTANGATIYNAISSSTSPIDSGLKLPIVTGTIGMFVVKYDSEGLAQWATIINGTSTDIGIGIAAMGSEIIVTGTYNSTSAVSIKRGNSVYLPVSSAYAAYLVKYNYDGIAQWATKYDSQRDDVGFHVTIDKNNNIIVGGYFSRGYGGDSSTVTIYNSDGTVNTTIPANNNNYDAGIIIKYNPNGFVQWAVFIDSDSDGAHDYIRNVATDSNGNVYGIGYHNANVATNFYNKNFTVGYTLLDPGTQGYDIFVVKYNADGNVEWVVNIGRGGDAADYGHGITVDENDYIYVTGMYNANVIATIYNAGNIYSGLSLPQTNKGYATFIVKFNSVGIAQWATTIDGTSTDYGYGIAAMGSEIAVTGFYTSTSSVPIRRANSIYLRKPIGDSAYLVKYNSDGIAQWAASVDGNSTTYTDVSYGITTDNNGNVYITGRHDGGTNSYIYNAGNQVSSIIFPYNTYYYDLFIVKFNSSGIAQWANKVGGTNGVGGSTNQEYSYGIVTDSDDNVYITGVVDRTGSITIYNNDMSTPAFEITDPGNTEGACILVKYNSEGTPQWAAIIDHASVNNDNESGFGITVDSNDNIYLTGKYGTANGATIYNAINSYTSPIDSGLSLPVGSGTIGAFVVKYNSDGLAQWATTIDGTGDDIGYGIAAMGSEIVVTGTYTSTSSVPIRRANSIYLRTPIGDSAYLVKYNSDGIAQWAASVDCSGGDNGYSVTTDSSGNIYITGRYDGGQLGTVYNAGNQASSITLPDNNSYWDLFIVKFNSDGEAQWANKIRADTTNNYSDYGYGIVTDSDDNVYITGLVDRIVPIIIYNTDTTVAFTISNNGNTSIACTLVKYDSDGEPQWAAVIDGTVNDYTERGHGVTVDNDDNIYLIGSYGSANGATIYNAINSSTSPIDSGLSLPVGSGTIGAFVVKYNSDGIAQWATIIDGSGDDGGYGIAAMGSEIAVTGTYVSTSSVPIRRANSISLPPASVSSTYLIKYNLDGIAQWAAGIYSADQGRGVATDSQGNVYITGYYDGTSTVYNADKSSVTLTDPTEWGGYLIKYNSTGIVQWIVRFDSSNGDKGHSITIDKDDNIIIGGSWWRETVLNIYNSDGTTAKTFSNDSLNSWAGIIIKYDPSGFMNWAVYIDCTSNYLYDETYGVTTDSHGNVYATGYENGDGVTQFYNADGSVGFSLPSKGLHSHDIFVVKYTINGYVEWVVNIGRGNAQIPDQGYGITVDENDYIYVTGQYSANAGATIYNAGDIDSGLSLPDTDQGHATFVVKFNSEGIAQWVTRIDGTGTDYGYGIASDGTNIIVTGYYTTAAGDITVHNATGGEQYSSLDSRAIIRSRQFGDASLVLENVENNTTPYGWKLENTTFESENTAEHKFTISYNTNYGTNYNNWTNYLTIDDSGAITYPGTLTSVSDARYKQNKEEVNNAIDIINKINIQKYDKTMVMLSDNYQGDLSEYKHHKEIGIIAQELLKIPELNFIVKQPTNSNIEPYSIDYNSIFSLAVKALQETNEELEKTKPELESIKSFLQTKFPGKI